LISLQQPLHVVFYLQLSEQVIFERIKDRMVHLPSGRVYNSSFNPPKVPGRDDITGELLAKRQDDNLETIRTRLQQFHESTMPLVLFYEKQKLLVAVNAPTSKIGYTQINRVLIEKKQQLELQLH
jgi:adenylate kinase